MGSPLQFRSISAENRLMDNSTIDLLGRALDYGSARLQAVSNNLSNVNTPGYKRQDVSFAALLARADGDAGAMEETLTMQRTDPRHLASEANSADGNGSLITTQNDGAMRLDGNSVDIDAETARLAQAQIQYEGTAQILQGQFAGLKYAISGGR